MFIEAIQIIFPFKVRIDVIAYFIIAYFCDNNLFKTQQMYNFFLVIVLSCKVSSIPVCYNYYHIN